MKILLVLCIACLVGVNSVSLNDAAATMKHLNDEIVQKCARELNFDEKKYINADFNSVDEETTCMMACSYRSLITDSDVAQELSGSTNKDTLYNGFIKLIDGAFETGFGEKSTGYSYEDIINKVNSCHAQESTECGFFKCVEVYKEPIILVAVHYYAINYLQQTD